MARPKFSLEQKIKEGKLLESLLEEAKKKDPTLTQECLADEMEVSQNLISQWVTGRTPIPDKRLLWLSDRLNFNPVQFRPEIERLALVSKLQGSARLAKLIRQIPPGAEDDVADILASVLDTLSKNRK